MKRVLLMQDFCDIKDFLFKLSLDAATASKIMEEFYKNFTAQETAEIDIKTEKPPIGLIPEKIHNEKRALKIMEAIIRYRNANKEVPEEWFNELGKLVFGR